MRKADILIVSLLGFTAVAIGAFGAHALEPILMENNTLKSFETGSRYHFYHTLVLLCLTLSPFNFKNAKTLFLAGILLFSGSLYIYALTSIKVFALITPIGGVLFLTGWVVLGYTGLKFYKSHDQKNSSTVS